MGSKKTQTQSTNTYSQITPQDTPDIVAARETPINNSLLNPAIDRSYGLAQQKLANQANSAFNFGVPLAQRNAMYNQQSRDLNYDAATAKAMGQYNNQQLLLNKNLTMAGLTAPRIVQSGGTTTTKESPGFLGIMGGLAQGVGAVAPFI